MGRAVLGLCLALSACSSREVFRHELEPRGWDLAFTQTLDADGQPRGPLTPFIDGASAHELAEDEAGFVVFGLRAEALPPPLGGRPSLEDPSAVRFSEVEVAHPGQGPHYGFDQARERLLLEPTPESPHLEVEGPFDLTGRSVEPAYLGAWRLSVPHQQACPSERRLVELDEVGFELDESPFGNALQLTPVDDRVAILRGQSWSLLRVRRGEVARPTDLLDAWTRSASLAASLEQVAVAPVAAGAEAASVFVAAHDRREGRELAGRLFHLRMPLAGPLTEVPVETLELPVDPALGYVPRLRGVAVAADGTVLAVGGWEDETKPAYGYFAVRPAGSPAFHRLELTLVGRVNGARGRAVAVLDRPGEPPVFAIGTSAGELVLLSFEGAAPRELPARFQLEPDEVSTRANVEWRSLRLRARPEGFEVWGSARDGVIVQRRLDGRWVLVGDLIRDRKLADPALGSCDRFGRLSQEEPDDLELWGDELVLAFRDCESLVRVLLDPQRDPICAGAIPPGSAAERGLELRSVVRWGSQLVAVGSRELRILRVADPP